MKAARRTCVTELGILALWDSDHFPMVSDGDSWAREVGDEAALAGHVAGGFLVPIRLNCPGAFDVEVRVSWSEERVALSDREAPRVAATSEAYLFRSSGRVCFSGLEFLDCVPSDQAGVLEIEPGDYEAVIHLLAWEEEPGSLDEAGRRSEEALPDLVVLLNRVTDFGFSGSGSLQTFR